MPQRTPITSYIVCNPTPRLSHDMEMKSEVMSPVSVLSGDHLKYALSDVNPKHSSKDFSVCEELSTGPYKVSWKVENDKERVKVAREIPSASRKREQSITLKKYDEDVRSPESSVSSEGTNDEKISLGSPPSKRRKVYLMPPFQDPETERKRRNAIIAYQNRQRRKEEMVRMESQLEKLRKINKEIESSLQHVTEELRQRHEELRRMHTQNAELLEAKRTLETQTRSQQEKFSVIREHILLINGSLEEGNIAKRFLDVLKERVDAAFSACVLHQSSANASSFVTITPPPGSTSPPPVGSPSFMNSIPPHHRPPPSLIRVAPSTPETTPSVKSERA